MNHFTVSRDGTTGHTVQDPIYDGGFPTYSMVSPTPQPRPLRVVGRDGVKVEREVVRTSSRQYLQTKLTNLGLVDVYPDTGTDGPPKKL